MDDIQHKLDAERNRILAAIHTSLSQLIILATQLANRQAKAQLIAGTTPKKEANNETPKQ